MACYPSRLRNPSQAAACRQSSHLLGTWQQPPQQFLVAFEARVTVRPVMTLLQYYFEVLAIC